MKTLILIGAAAMMAVTGCYEGDTFPLQVDDPGTAPGADATAQADARSEDGSRIDSGMADTGTPVDGARPDTGIDTGIAIDATSDAGPPDTGDAGVAIDAAPDSGPRDTGPPPIDGGGQDAAPNPDATSDAGPTPDATTPDAAPDAGPPDTGPPDAGPPTPPQGFAYIPPTPANGFPYDGRQVTLTRGFFLGETEVTQAQWFAVMGNLPAGNSCSSATRDCPIVGVSEEGMANFLNACSRREGLAECFIVNSTNGNIEWLANCNGYRLPTDAEWAWASQTDVPNWWMPVDTYAWHRGNSMGSAQRVRQKGPNPNGLHDVLGNIAELTWRNMNVACTETVDPVCGGRLFMPGWGSNFMGGNYESFPNLLNFAPEPPGTWCNSPCVGANIGLRIARDL